MRESAKLVEKKRPAPALQHFRIVARAHTLIRIKSEADVLAVLADAELGPAPKFVLGRRQQHRAHRRRQTGGAEGRDHRPPAGGRNPQGLDRGGRWRRKLARGRALDAGAGLAGLENMRSFPHHGRRPGAEHWRLRRGAAGPLRVARRHRPADRPDVYPERRPVRLSLPRLGVQARRCAGTRSAGAPAGLGLAGRALITACACACPSPGSRCWVTSIWSARWPRAAPPAHGTADLRLDLRHPPRQAARPASSATPAASSRTLPSRPSSAPTSSRATPRSCTTSWMTAP